MQTIYEVLLIKMSSDALWTILKQKYAKKILLRSLGLIGNRQQSIPLLALFCEKGTLPTGAIFRVNMF